MKELQQKELLRIVKFIEAIGCKYKIITDDGQEFGSLVVTEEKSHKRKAKRPYGELINFYKGLVDLNSPVGEVQVIPCNDYKPNELRGAICSYVGKSWGNGNYTTCVTDGKIEILRTA